MTYGLEYLPTGLRSGCPTRRAICWRARRCRLSPRLQSASLRHMATRTTRHAMDSDTDGKSCGHTAMSGGNTLAKLEEDEKWRANLAAMWQAVTENSNLSRLAVKNLLPVEVTTWDRPAWAAFLGRLETLGLGLWGNYEHRFMRQTYHDFQSNLGYHFYRHLSGKSSPLRRFALAAGSVLGSDDADLAPPFELSRSKGYRPHLRELYVKDCLVNGDLAVFIAERGRSTLRAVELVDCVSCTAQWERLVFDVPFSWANFFGTILETGDRAEIALERFALVRNWPVELDGDDEARDSGEAPDALGSPPHV